MDYHQLKSKAPPELVDQVIRTSASYVEDGRKDSLWDLCGGLSIQSSVPIPDADRDAVNRRSASASASSSSTSLFSTIFKMTSKPEIHESFPKSTFDDIKCSKCAASTISPSSKMFQEYTRRKGKARQNAFCINQSSVCVSRTSGFR